MSNPQNGSAGPIWARTLSGGVGAFIIGNISVPATVNVADPAGLADGNASMLSIDATGRLRVVALAASGATFTVVPFSAESVGASGRVVGVAAGTLIVSIAAGSLPAGTYDIQVFAVLDTGAPVAATDTNNMEFREGVTTISQLQVLPIITAYGPVRMFRRTLDGATAISVNATAAGTGGVGYNAQLIATRVL